MLATALAARADRVGPRETESVCSALRRRRPWWRGWRATADLAGRLLGVGTCTAAGLGYLSGHAGVAVALGGAVPSAASVIGQERAERAQVQVQILGGKPEMVSELGHSLVECHQA